MEKYVIDMDRLEKAVIAFYRSSTQEQAAAHAYLAEAQTSPQAWQFSWQLLHPGKEHQLQFFGAITLHQKLLHAWHEIPPENREELKQKILEKIVEYGAGPKLVLNRVCISLSVVIVHMIVEWPTAIDEIINLFQNQQIPNVRPDMQLWIMFEVIKGIPEELKSVRTNEKRAELRVIISSKFRQILTLVEDYLRQQLQRKWDDDSFANITHVVKCIGTWIMVVDYGIDQCVELCQMLLGIVNKCYWPCIREPDRDECMSADECELAEHCLRVVTSIIDNPESQNYPKTVLLLIKTILDTLSGITANEWKPNNNNEDIVSNIYSLYLSFLDSHSKLVFMGINTANPDLAYIYARIVNELMQCTNKPGIYPVEESSSCIGMGFWYMLQEEVMSMENREERMKYYLAIRPLYFNVASILVKKAEQPNEHSCSAWSVDDFETFRCYRQDIGDTFMYCCDVLGDDIVDVLMISFNEAVSQLQKNPKYWTQLEACLYSFYCVAEYINGDKSKEIAKLLRVIYEIPYDKMNEKLLGTALETAGAFCTWIRENSDFIPGAIQLFVRGLNSTMNTQATFGLKELSSECKIQMRPYATPLLDACHSALVSGKLKNPECVRLMYSVGHLMSLLKPESVPKYLDLFMGPCFEELQNMSQVGAQKTANTRIRTIFRLNMVATLFSSLNTEIGNEFPSEEFQTSQPVLLVIARTMPIFRRIAEFWVDEIEVIEAACNAIKFAVINLGNSFLPMLEELCYFIAALFQSQCCAPIIEISKTVATLFFREPNCKALMQQLVRELIQITIAHIEATPDGTLSNIADTLEAFYQCIATCLKKIPEALDDDGIPFDKLILNALKAMQLPEVGPIRASVQCLSHMIIQSRDIVRMTSAIQETGQCILQTVMLCISRITPRQQIERFADIFLALNKRYATEFPRWIKTVIQMPEFDNKITQEKKSKFVTTIIREKNNKRLIQQELMNFAKDFRGLSDKYY